MQQCSLQILCNNIDFWNISIAFVIKIKAHYKCVWGFFMFYSYVQTSEYVTNCFVWQNVMDKNIKVIWYIEIPRTHFILNVWLSKKWTITKNIEFLLFKWLFLEFSISKVHLAVIVWKPSPWVTVSWIRVNM